MELCGQCQFKKKKLKKIQKKSKKLPEWSKKKSENWVKSGKNVPISKNVWEKIEQCTKKCEKIEFLKILKNAQKMSKNAKNAKCIPPPDNKQVTSFANISVLAFLYIGWGKLGMTSSLNMLAVKNHCQKSTFSRTLPQVAPFRSWDFRRMMYVYVTMGQPLTPWALFRLAVSRRHAGPCNTALVSRGSSMWGTSPVVQQEGGHPLGRPHPLKGGS